ncbi:MAG: chromate efflux transporter [Alphaproteobacteria bacterium]
MTVENPPRPSPGPIPFSAAVRVWARIAALSFGGPAGQIAVMHRILVEEKRWLGERRFLHALNYCMLLPGPEAQQLAIYIGWLMHRTVGGLVAGLLFVLPGFLAIMGLSILYFALGDTGPVAAVFFGLKSAVLVIVVQAMLRIGGRALRNSALIAVAAAAFLGIGVLGAPFPLIILAAGLIGFLGARAGLPSFSTGGAQESVLTDDPPEAATVLGDSNPAHTQPDLSWALRTGAVILTLWLAPVVTLGLTLGWDNVFTQIAVFFSKMAVVTFGGAYAVLAYVAQEAVQTYGWLRPGEMLDGLALAETTPGPLIMVTQFVGFLGAARNATGLDPVWAGVLGGVLTTWVTFAPCFLWIFLGAPFVEALRGARALNAALGAITAAVVGVILNLALWFSLHVLFAEVREVGVPWLALQVPAPESLNLASLLLTLAAAVAAFGFKLGAVPLLIGCSLAGLTLHAAGQLA